MKTTLDLVQFTFRRYEPAFPVRFRPEGPFLPEWFDLKGEAIWAPRWTSIRDSVKMAWQINQEAVAVEWCGVGEQMQADVEQGNDADHANGTSALISEYGLTSEEFGQWKSVWAEGLKRLTTLVHLPATATAWVFPRYVRFVALFSFVETDPGDDTDPWTKYRGVLDFRPLKPLREIDAAIS